MNANSPDRDYPITQLKPVPDVDRVLRGGMEMPYARRRRALWLRKQRSPRFLYKFRALHRDAARDAFSDESIERLRVPIVRSLLRLSAPDELNDPFELGAQLIVEGTARERQARFTALIKEQMPHANFKQRERAVRYLMEDPAATLLPMLRDSYARQRRGFGVCCFAGRDPANVLMWSHYADEHRGICLQFELARDLQVFMRALTVDYVDEYPTVNWALPGFPEQIGLTFTRKHSRWKYEGERRILQHDCARTFLHLDPAALVGIIFGCRAGTNVKAAVGSLLEERAARGMPPIKLYYARQNAKRYELDIWSRDEA